MIKLTGLNKEEVEAISKQIADAFYDYEYNEADLGLVKYIRSRLLKPCRKKWRKINS